MANHIQNRGLPGSLHLTCMFTDVCACEIRCREVNEACRCACPDGIAPSKVSTNDDACDNAFLISAKSVTLLFRPLSASMYWAIQRSWFARVNALCNLSAKKSREVAAHFRADF